MQAKQGEKYICHKHNQKIIKVVIEENIHKSDSLFCDTCVEQCEQQYRFYNVYEAEDMIQEKLRKLNEGHSKQIEKRLDQLKKIQQRLLEYKSTIISAIDDIGRYMQQWITQLTNETNKDYTLDLIKGIEFLKQDQEEVKKLLQQHESSFQEKIHSRYEKLLAIGEPQKSFEDFQKILIHQKPQEQELEFQIIQQEPEHITFSQATQIKQEQYCGAIAFNRSGTIMVAGSDGNIRVWQLHNEQMKIVTELIGLTGKISSIVYSKKKEWFISGDISGNVQLWKQGKCNSKWLEARVQDKGYEVNCMVLNKQENELITGGRHHHLYVYSVDYEKNHIEFLYAFPSNTFTMVYGLSINGSDTELVQWTEIGEIIIWEKVESKKWILKNKLDYGEEVFVIRVCFVTDNLLVAKIGGEKSLSVYQIQKQELIELQNSKIQIRNENESPLIPTIYNNKKNALIQQTGRYVCILNRGNDGYYKMSQHPIALDGSNHESLSQDGQHLALWIQEQKEFIIYKLNYR